MGRHTKAFDEEPSGYDPQGRQPSPRPHEASTWHPSSAPRAGQPPQPPGAAASPPRPPVPGPFGPSGPDNSGGPPGSPFGPPAPAGTSASGFAAAPAGSGGPPGPDASASREASYGAPSFPAIPPQSPYPSANLSPAPNSPHTAAGSTPSGEPSYNAEFAPSGGQRAEEKGSGKRRAAKQPEGSSSSSFSWVGRVPLMPALAGIVAVGIVATAYGTSNISLNFTGGAPSGPTQADPQCSATANGEVCPEQTDDTTRASRGSTRPSPYEVDFATTSHTGGFRGVVTVANHGAKALHGWTLTFSIPNAQVLSLSGLVVVVRKGPVTTVRTQRILAAGSSAKVTFLARGTAGEPDSCTFNSAPCPLPGPTP